MVQASTLLDTDLGSGPYWDTGDWPTGTKTGGYLGIRVQKRAKIYLQVDDNLTLRMAQCCYALDWGGPVLILEGSIRYLASRNT